MTQWHTYTGEWFTWFNAKKDQRDSSHWIILYTFFNFPTTILLTMSLLYKCQKSSSGNWAFVCYHGHENKSSNQKKSQSQSQIYFPLSIYYDRFAFVLMLKGHNFKVSTAYLNPLIELSVVIPHQLLIWSTKLINLSRFFPTLYYLGSSSIGTVCPQTLKSLLNLKWFH